MLGAGGLAIIAEATGGNRVEAAIVDALAPYRDAGGRLPARERVALRGRSGLTID